MGRGEGRAGRRDGCESEFSSLSALHTHNTVTGRLRSTSKAGKTLGLANGSTALGGCLAWLEAPVRVGVRCLWPPASLRGALPAAFWRLTVHYLRFLDLKL